MDKRIKKLALEGLINRVSADPGAGLEPAYLLKKDFVDRVIELVSSLDEEVMLYLSGDVKVPEIGSTFVNGVSGEDVEYAVEAIDYHHALVDTTYTTDGTFYFKSTEDANNFINTGNKGNYNNWSRSKSDTYPFVGTARVTERRTFSFSDF